jgi:protocatechuate 3,4-dioxygenase alpha subunit
MLGLTPSQTVGPYFKIGLERLFCSNLVPSGRESQATTISGQVLDADRHPVPDAMLEFWHADEAGRYTPAERATDFLGWARVPTDTEGRFSLRTIRPGTVQGPNATLQAPHISVAIFMRGLLRHLFTRIYFEGDASNAKDWVLLRVPESRRTTLIAKRSGKDANLYLWNIVLQGTDETVFFDW